MINAASWPQNFPPVTHFIDPADLFSKPWKILTSHPDYNAAKNSEDRNAALRLVKNFMESKDNLARLSDLKHSFPNAVIVPVHAIEAGGKNKIPLLLAEYIGKQTGLDVNFNVVQINKVHRTGSSMWHRFAFRPQFEGTAQQDRPHILVDDVFTSGGSFNELRLHLLKQNAPVVHTAALSLGGHGQHLALSQTMRSALLDVHREHTLSSFLKEINVYDGNFNNLTEPEAFALRRTPSLDAARDRIFEARCQGHSRMGEDSSRGRETAPLITRPCTCHRR